MAFSVHRNGNNLIYHRPLPPSSSPHASPATNRTPTPGLEPGAREDGGVGARVRDHAGMRHGRVCAGRRRRPGRPGGPQVHGYPAGGGPADRVARVGREGLHDGAGRAGIPRGRGRAVTAVALVLFSRLTR